MTRPVDPARLAAEADAARDYARAIRSGELGPGAWHDLNRSIVERWSRTALTRVKRQAWDIVEGSERYGQ